MPVEMTYIYTAGYFSLRDLFIRVSPFHEYMNYERCVYNL